MRLIAYTDGAARGNPGPAAYGAVVLGPDGGELRVLAEAIGRTTNNVAEYRGAIAAVEAALELGATRLDLYLDSELIVRQLEGRYRVRNAKLKPLYSRLRALIDRLDAFGVHHVPRAANARADALANAALDGRDPDVV
ncbi:MAG: ribonuclease HI family protein [Dehalococcoidia bacterium]